MIESFDDESITVTARPGEQYRIGGGQWMTPEEGASTFTFDGLDPATEYTIEARMAETDTDKPSPASEPTVQETAKADQEQPAVPDADDIETTDSSITVEPTEPGQQYVVVPVEDYPDALTEDYWTENGQISEDGEPLTFDELDPNTDYVVVTRLPGDDRHNPSPASEPTPVTTDRRDQTEAPTVPDADTEITTTDHSLTVDPAADGQEYIVVPAGTDPDDLTEDDWADAQIGEDGEPLTFDGLDPNTEYVVVTRIPGDETNKPSAPLASEPVTTDMADQDAPAKPTITGATPDSITVEGRDGEEYIVVPSGTDPDDYDWTNAQTPEDGSVVFEDLTPGTEYSVVSRRAADEAHNASDPSQPANTTTPKEPQDAPATPPKAEATSATSLTIKNVKPDEEYSVDGGKTWVKPEAGARTLLIDGLNPGETYPVISRKAETETSKPSKPSDPTNVRLPKAPQDAPDTAPSVRSATANAIVVNAEPELEYSIDNGKTWVKDEDGDGTITFDGLEPRSYHEILSRRAETDTLLPSAPSAPARTTTDKANQDAPEDKPTATAATDDATGTSTITVTNPDPDQEYIVVPANTDLTALTDADWADSKKPEGDEPLTFDGLTPGEDYVVLTRMPADDTHYPSPATASDPIATDLANQTAPATKPTATAATDDTTGTSTITVTNPDPDQEYIVVPAGTTPTEADWANAQTPEGDEPLTFDGLTPGEDYVVLTRVPGDDTHNPSPATSSDPIATDLADQTAPATKPTATATTDDATGTSTITVTNADPDQEYSIDGTNWVKPDADGNVTFTGLTPGVAQTVQTRVPGDDTHNPSPATSSAPITPPLANQTAPSTAPTATATSPTTITVTNADPNQEYSADGTNWVSPSADGTVTFTGLTPGQTYNVVSRRPGDATHNPSPSSPATSVTLSSTPTAPEIIEHTDTTMTVRGTPGQEYIVVLTGAMPTNEDWANAQTPGSDGNVVFTGLTAGQAYEVFTRLVGSTETVHADGNTSGVIHENVDPDPSDATHATATGLDNPQLQNSVFTQEEQQSIYNGVNANLWIAIRNITGNVPATDRQLSENVIHGIFPRAIFVEWLDVTMWKQLLDGIHQPEQVHDTKGPKVTLRGLIPSELLPVNLKASNNIIREFFLTHVHDGKATIVWQGTANSTTQSLEYEVETSLFSTYGLAYADQAETPAQSPVIAGTTATTVTVRVVPGQEYSIDGGANWRTASSGETTLTFTGLNPETDYQVITRVAAYGDVAASDPTAPTVATTKAKPDSSSSSGSGGGSSSSGSPKTGDESKQALWSVLLIASLAGVIAILLKRRRRENK